LSRYTALLRPVVLSAGNAVNGPGPSNNLSQGRTTSNNIQVMKTAFERWSRRGVLGASIFTAGSINGEYEEHVSVEKDTLVTY